MPRFINRSNSKEGTTKLTELAKMKCFAPFSSWPGFSSSKPNFFSCLTGYQLYSGHVKTSYRQYLMTNSMTWSFRQQQYPGRER